MRSQFNRRSCRVGVESLENRVMPSALLIAGSTSLSDAPGWSPCWYDPPESSVACVASLVASVNSVAGQTSVNDISAPPSSAGTVNVNAAPASTNMLPPGIVNAAPAVNHAPGSATVNPGNAPAYTGTTNSTSTSITSDTVADVTTMGVVASHVETSVVPTGNPGSAGGSFKDSSMAAPQQTNLTGGFRDLSAAPAQQDGYTGGFRDLSAAPAQQASYTGGFRDLSAAPAQQNGYTGGFRDLNAAPAQQDGFGGSYKDSSVAPSQSTSLAAHDAIFAQMAAVNVPMATPACFVV